jgi:succinoglycan biosynthesis protein ExoM
MNLDKVGLTVCICTLRRPGVVTTIDSIAKQIMPTDAAVRVIVIDNDIEPTAQNIVKDFCSRINLHVDYRHAPGQNISIARNAALDATITPWLAFMDDDEYASSSWLAKLFAERHGANAVFGPCEAIYGDGTPNWIKWGDYHSNRISRPKKPIVTGYTSNALIDMNFVRRHNLRFDTTLGRTGGEDSMFFYAMHRKGGVLKYASNAIVYENIVPARATLNWIVRRRYRSGQVLAMILRRFDRASYRRVSLAVPFKIAICAVMSAATLISRTHSLWWLMRGTLHCGVLSYVLGASIHEEYGSPHVST